MLIDGINYDVRVEGDGEAVLLLHGFTGSNTAWDELFESNQDFKLVAPSLIGHGLTDSPENVELYSIEHAARDLVKILDELKIKKVHCLGYSMGGRVAVMFATMFPKRVESLILVSTSTGLELEKDRATRRAKDSFIAGKILDEGVENFINTWEKLELFESNEKCLSAETKIKLRKSRLANNPKGLANSLLGMGAGTQPYLMSELRNFNFPTLLINGEYDEKYIMIMSEMASHLQNCKMKTISGCGHMVQLENFEEFGKMVFKFLKSGFTGQNPW